VRRKTEGVKAKGDLSRIADQLPARFLEGGNYAFSGPLSGAALRQILPAATAEPGVERFFEEAGFSGLTVQSVGIEEATDEPKMHVYVAKGSRKAEKGLSELEPQVPIQINRVGRVIVRPEAASGAAARGHVFQRRGRVACGSSCAPAGESYPGTLGALVRKGSARNLYALSNNHVLAACNHIPVGMPILSPSGIDARPGIRAPGEVCRHAEICELRSGVPALVSPGREDVALAEVPDPGLVSSWQGEGTGSYDTPSGVVSPRSGMRVRKIGRTTGLTLGTIEAHLRPPFPLPYKARFFAATVWFQDVWTVRAEPRSAFALPGDSGSLVVTEGGDRAIGLVFAASPQGDYGFVIPMIHIVTLFGGLSLVSAHGT
jgi:hypothetical protein